MMTDEEHSELATNEIIRAYEETAYDLYGALHWIVKFINEHPMWANECFPIKDQQSNESAWFKQATAIMATAEGVLERGLRRPGA